MIEDEKIIELFFERSEQSIRDACVPGSICSRNDNRYEETENDSHYRL